MFYAIPSGLYWLVILAMSFLIASEMIKWWGGNGKRTYAPDPKPVGKKKQGKKKR
jgi:hypothetical protein